MYVSYWINKLTGELFRSGSPKDNPKDIWQWKQISDEEFILFRLAISNPANDKFAVR